LCTKEKFKVVINALQNVIQDKPNSLEDECLSIMRALMMFSKIHQGKNIPIGHPKFGLT
jgi:hypothetical protein